MTRWEYKIVIFTSVWNMEKDKPDFFGCELDDADYPEQVGLNILGERGFELVGMHNRIYQMTNGNVVHDEDELIYIFKRQIDE